LSPQLHFEAKNGEYEQSLLGKVSGSGEELSLRDLLVTLIGPEGRRRLELRQLQNDKLFALYQADLILRVRNKKNLKNVVNLLGRFKDYLGQYPPSETSCKAFLAQYTQLKPHTWYNYVGEMKRFMLWYGEGLTLKAKLPKSMPTYHEDKDIEAILSVIQLKKTHKKIIERDTLLVELGWRTGLRRAELANLEARDIHTDFLAVRHGKGQKDRLIPLTPTIAEKLHSFTTGMKPNEKILKLNVISLGMKVKDFAKRAGLNDFHCHSLRHKFATDLLEKGADIRVVQQLMGHENLNTTQVYLAITDKRLRDAVNLLESGNKSQEQPKKTSTVPSRARDDDPGWMKAIVNEFKNGKKFIPLKNNPKSLK
jgi:integrase